MCCFQRPSQYMWYILCRCDEEIRALRDFCPLATGRVCASENFARMLCTTINTYICVKAFVGGAREYINAWGYTNDKSELSVISLLTGATCRCGWSDGCARDRCPGWHLFRPF